MLDAAEKFKYLMDVIEYWTDDDPKDRHAGPFRHLSRELWIRKICVTPGCSVSVAQIKTFFAAAVLEIYPWDNRSKVSYRDIQRYLSGEGTVKKYSFFLGELEKCFSKKENEKAAKKTVLCQNICPLIEKQEETEMVFLYLLEKLQAMARIKIGEYWHMCALDSEASGGGAGGRIKWKQKSVQGQDQDEDAALIQRQNKYMEYLMTVALHEIFVRECERQVLVLEETLSSKQDVLKDVKEKIRILAGESDMAQESFGTWAKDIEGSVQEVVEYTKQMSRYVVLFSEYAEYVAGVEAEILLVMVLETKNLNAIKRGVILEQKMTQSLKFMEDRSTESFLRYNKNRGKYYRELEKEIQEIIVRYMERYGHTAEQSFSEAISVYLKTVENARPNTETRGLLWETQCALIMPMWHANDP